MDEIDNAVERCRDLVNYAEQCGVQCRKAGITNLDELKTILNAYPEMLGFMKRVVNGPLTFSDTMPGAVLITS